MATLGQLSSNAGCAARLPHSASSSERAELPTALLRQPLLERGVVAVELAALVHIGLEALFPVLVECNLLRNVGDLVAGPGCAAAVGVGFPVNAKCGVLLRGILAALSEWTRAARRFLRGSGIAAIAPVATARTTADPMGAVRSIDTTPSRSTVTEQRLIGIIATLFGESPCVFSIDHVSMRTNS